MSGERERGEEATRYLYCAKCGSRNIEQAQFCQGCGRTIKHKVQETGFQQYTPTTIRPEKPYQDTTKETVPQQSVERKITPGSTLVKKIGSGVTIARKAKNRANQTTSLEIQYADFSERLLAAIIDGLLVIIVPFPVVIVSSWIGQSLAGGEDWGLITGFCVGWIFVLALAWVYYAIMESSSQQATLGKIVMGIIVTNREQQRISFGRASKRYIGKIISLVILGIGFIMIARTEKKQGLHDMIAGSFVLEKRHRSTRNII
jgi:uncharacterized RDD family membrane protein YckC